jgi:hypothetical protein
MKRRFAELAAQSSDLGRIRQGMVEEAQQVHLESCRIEALASPGLISVTATLVRAGAQ